MSERETIAVHRDWELFRDDRGMWIAYKRMRGQMIDGTLHCPVPPEAIQALQNEENERLRKLLFYLADSVAAYRSCGTATNALRLAANLDAAIDAAKKELLI